MPTIKLNGADLHYEEAGSGPESMLFSHGLFFDHQLFREQVAAFKDRYRCVSYDLRGHGGSELTESGYDVETLADDAALLIEELGLAPCHLIGWSTGGFLGIRLALRRPELLRSLILIGAATFDGALLPPKLKVLSFALKLVGAKTLAGPAIGAMLSKATLRTERGRALRDEFKQKFAANRALGVARMTEGAVAQKSVLNEVGKIEIPVLLIRGAGDDLIRLSWMKDTADAIPRAKLVEIPETGRACNLENPDAVNRAIEEFLHEAPAKTGP